MKRILLIASITIVTISLAMDNNANKSTIKSIDSSVEAAIAKALNNCEPHIYKLLDAYKECAKAENKLEHFFEPCSEVLRLEGDITEYRKIKIFYDLMKEYGEDTIRAIIINNPELKHFEKKLNRLDSLRTRFSYSYSMFSKKLIVTREKMRQDIDTSHINNSFPIIIRDACNEKSMHFGRPSCKDLQGYFYGLQKYLEKDYTYHPFRNVWDYIEEPGTLLISYPKFVALTVGHIAGDLNLSAKTTHELKDLMLQAYKGNGHCEAGPLLNRNVENKQIIEEHAQFPEPLRKSCNLFGWDECGMLRNMVYDIQNPSQNIPTSYDEELTPEKLAWHPLWDIYRNDKGHIPGVNRNIQGNLCENNKVFGCHSHEEANEIIEQFDELLKRKE